MDVLNERCIARRRFEKIGIVAGEAEAEAHCAVAAAFEYVWVRPTSTRPGHGEKLRM